MLKSTDRISFEPMSLVALRGAIPGTEIRDLRGMAIGEVSTAIAKRRNFDYFAVMSRRRSQSPAGSMGGAT